MMYSSLRPLLFQLPAECAHHVTLHGLRLLDQLHLLRTRQYPSNKKILMGVEFPNILGLAAGLDKNGEYVDPLSKLGFGFIEIGSVTPKAQSGNPKPRLFRLKEDRALINRMGFNNKGVDYLVAQVKRVKYQGVLGINIGKNADTPMEKAYEDYIYSMKKVYCYASYIVVNISSPNTKNLRDLQHDQAFIDLLDALKQTQHQLTQQHSKKVPVVIKIAPDLADNEIELLAKHLLTFDVDGVIATNTSFSREGLLSGDKQQKGGLSGEPILESSTRVVSRLSNCLQGKIPIIGLGGIHDATSAQAKIKAGADLLQIYTGLIYRGPELIKEVLSESCISK